MITLILSDLHLGARNSRTDLLSALLRSDFDRLILNGDTVDSLNFQQFRRGDWQVVEQLRGIARERELVLIRGNHDGWTEADPGFGSLDVLGDLLGTEMHEEYELHAADGRYLVLHGDQFDRTLNLTWVGHTADWCYHRIQRMSRPTARWLKGRVKHWGGVVASVKRGAIPHARTRGFSGVITGHTHYCDDDQTADGFRYMNTGCWVDWPCSYIRVEDGHARLAHWLDDRTPRRAQPVRLALAQ
ncbi:MAG: metallophosphoesterase [Gemmataceae bacterium]|nr:metallophosphoesterase [Gemmataceae bacterium]